MRDATVVGRALGPCHPFDPPVAAANKATAVGATDEADTERGVMGHKKDTVLSGAETLQDTAHGQ